MPLLKNEGTPEENDFAIRWYRVRQRIKDDFGKRPDLNAMLFIIGMNELGLVKENWEKEEKLNLMHIAVCSLLSSEGYYRLAGRDHEGWPQYEAQKGLPVLNMKEQEELLKRKIVEYFEDL